jgi:hypothetical protein
LIIGIAGKRCEKTAGIKVVTQRHTEKPGGSQRESGLEILLIYASTCSAEHVEEWGD